jgi:hypothetical protein
MNSDILSPRRKAAKENFFSNVRTWRLCAFAR